MGQRQLTLLGRIGMVLLVSGLALGLVSFIPSISYSGYGGQFPIDAQKYMIVPSYTSGVYTPQVGLSISVQSNTSVYLYLLSVNGEFFNWTATLVTKNYPNATGFQIWSGAYNLTVLNAVLQLHPDIILWNSSLGKSISHEFYPTTVLNVTAIVANPSNDSITVNVVSKVLTSFAPKERVSLAAEFLIPIGLVLAAPWAIRLKARKKAPAE